jgi:hypothetical protein
MFRLMQEACRGIGGSDRKATPARRRCLPRLEELEGRVNPVLLPPTPIAAIEIPIPAIGLPAEHQVHPADQVPAWLRSNFTPPPMPVSTGIDGAEAVGPEDEVVPPQYGEDPLPAEAPSFPAVFTEDDLPMEPRVDSGPIPAPDGWEEFADMPVETTVVDEAAVDEIADRDEAVVDVIPDRHEGGVDVIPVRDEGGVDIIADRDPVLLPVDTTDADDGAVNATHYPDPATLPIDPEDQASAVAPEYYLAPPPPPDETSTSAEPLLPITPAAPEYAPRADLFGVGDAGEEEEEGESEEEPLAPTPSEEEAARERAKAERQAQAEADAAALLIYALEEDEKP